MYFIYEFFRIIGIVTGYPLQALFFKRKTFYEDKKATKLRRGGKLIISNHFNLFDYVLNCFIVFPRRLTAVTGEHAFRNPFLRVGMKFFGTIEANRETRSMKFMDKCVEVIKRGKLVQIFPEGRNTPDGKIHEFKHSYLVIAYRAGCPVVPIVTDGNYHPFRRVRVYIGKEIDVSPFFTEGRRTPPREELERANEYVFNKVLELRALLDEDRARTEAKKAERRARRGRVGKPSEGRGTEQLVVPVTTAETETVADTVDANKTNRKEDTDNA